MAVIYALADPDNGEVRYIGSTNNPKTRLASHIREGKKTRDDWFSGKTTCTKKAFWLFNLLLSDKVPSMIILQACPLAEKLYWECFWMGVYTHDWQDSKRLLNTKWLSRNVIAKK